jgi:RNA polymerase sigma factor (sigma-70 family)
MVHSQVPERAAAAAAPAVARSAAAAPAKDDRRTRLAALLEAARVRRSALDGIVAELSPLLWQVARAQGLDRTAAEDVVQTTWLSLLRNLDTIRTPEALVGWLVMVAKREAWRVIGADRRQQPVADTAFAGLRDPASTPDDQVVDHERRRVLWAAVDRLPQRCRELLRIVAFVHRPEYDAVSTALGLPRGSIGPTRGRCLNKLRALLATDPKWSWQ